MITFTGGVAIGKYIANKAGYRRMVLELGGNDPLIVMEDADLAKAAELAAAGAFKNSGQRCTAVKRIFVQKNIADDFVALLTNEAKKLICGDPSDPETDIGTVIDEEAAMLFERRVEDAIAEGDKANAQAALTAAQPEMMRGVTKGVAHRNTVSRRISRLSARIKSMEG